MMEETHIADRIAVKLLLAAIVVASGTVGALGLAPAASQVAAGGPADEPVTAAFPIDNFSVSGGSHQLSLDGKGNDPYPTAFSIDAVTAAFPIDNATATMASLAPGSATPVGATGIGSVDANAWVLAAIGSPTELPQDMDPY